MTLGDRLGLVEHAGEMRVGEPPLVRRRRVLSAIRQIDVAGIDGGEFPDHGLLRLNGIDAPAVRRVIPPSSNGPRSPIGRP